MFTTANEFVSEVHDRIAFSPASHPARAGYSSGSLTTAGSRSSASSSSSSASSSSSSLGSRGGIVLPNDGDDTPVDQPDGNVLGDAMGHVGSCWMSRHSRTDVSARSRGGQSFCEVAHWLMGPGPQTADAA